MWRHLGTVSVMWFKARLMRHGVFLGGNGAPGSLCVAVGGLYFYQTVHVFGRVFVIQKLPTTSWQLEIAASSKSSDTLCQLVRTY